MGEILYVHIDGMDLAGKGLACKNVMALSGIPWEVRKNRLSDTNLIHDFADKLRMAKLFDTETVGLLYWAALNADLKSFVPPQKNTLQDGAFALKSFALHTVNNTPRLPALFNESLEHHPQFDASFVLTASIPVRAERLRQRQLENAQSVSHGDLMVVENPRKFLAIEDCLIKTAQRVFRSSVIDTSTMTPDEVCRAILSRLSLR